MPVTPGFIEINLMIAEGLKLMDSGHTAESAVEAIDKKKIRERAYEIYQGGVNA